MSLGKSPTQYLGVLAKRPPNVITADRAPVTGTDKAFVQGDLWLDTSGPSVFMFMASGATWIALGTGATGGVVTITGDTGGAESPSAGNFNLKGTANQIIVTGTANTETFHLSTTLVAPGSIVATTSIASTTTMTAGTGLTATTGNITASAGNIVATLGSVSAATTVTAGTGITSTTGNIVATAGQVNAGTSMTAGTSITATLGNITATNGNIVKNTAGNKDVYTSVATTTAAGANSAGTVTLSGGTATVATTAVTASSKIRMTRQGIGATGAAALGFLTVGTITAGTSFVIRAVEPADATTLQATDVSSIWWEIVN